MALDAQTAAHLEEQRTIRTQHKPTYQLLGSLTLVVIGVWLGAQLFGGDPGFTVNVYTEALSVLVTVLVIKWFDDRRATNQRKQQLFLQLGSQSNDFALEAKRQLEIEGWLEEALAQKEFLRANWQSMILKQADLTNAQLGGANLAKAELWGANLAGAKMRGTTLIDAFMPEANLSNADLFHAKLTNANLTFASLANANLYGADLTNTSLWDAELCYAKLAYVRFDERTMLPDRTRWTPTTDMARFTNPAHPQFWRSDALLSPAYGGG